MRLLLDDDTVVAIDATIFEVTDEALKELGLGPEGRLTVTIGGRELWPHNQTR